MLCSVRDLDLIKAMSQDAPCRAVKPCKLHRLVVRREERRMAQHCLTRSDTMGYAAACRVGTALAKNES